MTAKLAFLHDPPLARIKLEQVDGQRRTDRVYRQMRDRLMRGNFMPHQRLRITELSQAFGTSETPVREAIFQLIRDGAVEAKTHSYFRVRNCRWRNIGCRSACLNRRRRRALET
jgi:DNA-binding GntR family transcriptional regulator